MPPPAGSTPTLLDPLGALIYYLCVTEAIHEGTYIVPSSQRISSLLRVEGIKKKKPVNAQVLGLWTDLSWINRTKLLLNETEHEESEYFRSLSQHNVNRRIQNFRPGFVQTTAKQRRIDTSRFVERIATAVRLIALKDTYYYTQRDLPQKLLLSFLRSENLVPDEDEFYTFIYSMTSVGYIALDPPTEILSDSDRNRRFVLEPGQVFRAQDMYLELRSLDFFGEQQSADRRTRRLDLRKRAQQFVLKNKKLSGSS